MKALFDTIMQLVEDLPEENQRRIMDYILKEASTVMVSPRELTFDIVLTGIGPEVPHDPTQCGKIRAIKAVRNLCVESLRDAKTLVEGLPSVLMSGVASEAVDKILEGLRDAGCEVKARPTPSSGPAPTASLSEDDL